MTATRLAWRPLTVVLAITGCGSGANTSPSAHTLCTGTAQAALVRGATSESYLGLSAAEIRSVVQVVDAAQWSVDAAVWPEGGLCSGTFVASNWVLTARHCLEIQTPAVVLAGASPDHPMVLPAQQVAANADEDVALLRVEAPAVTPIVPGVPMVRALVPGDVVELAGYGLTESNTVGSLRFLVETVTAMDTATVTVDGFGSTGACAGDSGGPLLVRGDDGTPRVAAVLTTGSASCTGVDEYVRVDAVGPWISATIGPSTSNDGDCGSLTDSGRCLYGGAVWCDGGRIVAQPCTGVTQCGWDRTQGAFRCVDPSSDPCDGIDDVGACRDGAAKSCRNGLLATQVCAPCGVCRVEGSTGRPGCEAPVASDP